MIKKKNTKNKEPLKIGVISIGNELLKGFTLNTNLTNIAQILLQAGLEIQSCRIIKDSSKDILKNIDEFLKENFDIIITTGGLGPTADDITKQCICEHFNLKLTKNNDICKQINTLWKKKNTIIPENVYVQALTPEQNTIVLKNNNGTAPGLIIELPEHLASIIMLPGPPREMNPMFQEQCMPYIQKKNKNNIYTETLIVRALPESQIEERCKPYLNNSYVEIAYCASFESVKIYLSSKDRATIKSLKNQLENEFTNNVLPQNISNIYELLIHKLILLNKTVSTAESCTGGLIASALTSVSGSSKCFKGSIISYSNDWKSKLLKVPEHIFLQYGAVSAECVEAMLSVKDLYKTNTAIAITGIAGPNGGTKEKPIGTVFIAAKSDEHTKIKKFNFSGNREAIRQKAAVNGINILLELLNQIH